MGNQIGVTKSKVKKLEAVTVKYVQKDDAESRLSSAVDILLSFTVKNSDDLEQPIPTPGQKEQPANVDSYRTAERRPGAKR